MQPATTERVDVPAGYPLSYVRCSMTSELSKTKMISSAFSLPHFSLVFCLCDSSSRYRTFVRIGSGLTFADYVWIRQKPWKERDPKQPPSWLLTAKRGTDDKGDVYLEPKECVPQFRPA